jgi:hypothetical protein
MGLKKLETWSRSLWKTSRLWIWIDVNFLLNSVKAQKNMSICQFLHHNQLLNDIFYLYWLKKLISLNFWLQYMIHNNILNGLLIKSNSFITQKKTIVNNKISFDNGPSNTMLFCQASIMCYISNKLIAFWPKYWCSYF